MTNRVISFLILGQFVWLNFSNSRKKTKLPKTEDFISIVQEINSSDRLKNSIIGFQPFKVLDDSLTKEQFKNKIEKYILRAREEGLIKDNSITEGQAWEKYALPGQLNKTNIQVGMNVFLQAELWNLGTDGQPLVYFKGSLIPVSYAQKSGIWSLNF